MKRLLLAMTCLATLTVTAQASPLKQDTISVINLNSAQTQAQRIADKLMLDDKTTAKFIPIYEDYRKELKEIGKKNGNNKQPEQMTDAQINEQIKANFERQQKQLDIQKKYYKKFSTILTPKQVYELFQKGRAGRLYPFPNIPPRVRIYDSDWFDTPEGKKAEKSLKRAQKIMESKEVQEGLKQAAEAGRIINRNLPRYFKYDSQESDSEE